MADVTVNVIEPATNFDFLTLDEAKILLGITPSDTSQDAQLAMLISIYSANVAEMCNRTFAREKVMETWRELYNGRVFLTHYPVKLEDDIELASRERRRICRTINTNSSRHRANCRTCCCIQRNQPVAAVGRCDLYRRVRSADRSTAPAQASDRDSDRRAAHAQSEAQVAGIRQVTHKSSRIVFFDPNASVAKQSGSKSPGRASGRSAAQAVHEAVGVIAISIDTKPLSARLGAMIGRIEHFKRVGIGQGLSDFQTIDMHRDQTIHDALAREGNGDDQDQAALALRNEAVGKDATPRRAPFCEIDRHLAGGGARNISSIRRARSCAPKCTKCLRRG